MFASPRSIYLNYTFRVISARKYLRLRDFLHYLSQLVPERVESETWSLAWAYIRNIDDVIDRPSLTTNAQQRILEEEWSLVKRLINNSGEVALESKNLRHHWLQQFIRNLYDHYDKDERRKILEVVENLYQSAVLDAQRRWRILSEQEMRRLLYLKAVRFFELYFLLGRIKLQGYLTKLAELLGLGLGMLDDILDALYDWRGGYINLTLEDLEKTGIKVDPRDKLLLRAFIDQKVLHYKAAQILRLLLRARIIGWKIKDPLARNLILRLTEVFAAPILEGRFIPGSKYFFKGGKLIFKVLPRDEMLAYEVGHRMVKKLIRIPQLAPSLVKLWVKMTY